jgi:hypothetical protein
MQWPAQPLRRTLTAPPCSVAVTHCCFAELLDVREKFEEGRKRLAALKVRRQRGGMQASERVHTCNCSRGVHAGNAHAACGLSHSVCASSSSQAARHFKPS